MASANTMFEKAVANYETARILHLHAAQDEDQLNSIGFHLQQSLEMALKYLLEQNGIEYPRTHDIDQLILLGKDAEIELWLTDYIEDHAEMFSQWESKSRYVLGYAIEPKKIDRALKEVKAYLKSVKEGESAVVDSIEVAVVELD